MSIPYRSVIVNLLVFQEFQICHMSRAPARSYFEHTTAPYVSRRWNKDHGKCLLRIAESSSVRSAHWSDSVLAKLAGLDINSRDKLYTLSERIYFIRLELPGKREFRVKELTGFLLYAYKLVSKLVTLHGGH